MSAKYLAATVVGLISMTSPAIAATTVCSTPNPAGVSCTFDEGSFTYVNSTGIVTISSLYNSSSRTVTDFHISGVQANDPTVLGIDFDLPRAAGPGPINPLPPLSFPSAATFTVTDAYFTPRVAEPQTWAMMIMGFAALGGAMRFRGRRPRPHRLLDS